MANSTLIIAEAGVNHNGSIDMAIELVDVAANAGADYVKFQTFKAESLTTKATKKATYQIKNTNETETQFSMLKKLELSEKDHETLVKHCAKKNIGFLSTPFDVASLDMLINNFDIPFIKVSSGEITNAPFLLEIAKRKKPIILSTGMSNLGEIEQALGVIAYGFIDKGLSEPSRTAFELAYASKEGKEALNSNLTLLHCSSEYPAPLEDINLNAIKTLKTAFSLPVGYSDHSAGITISIAAVALGATVIEKHFTTDKSLPGPDHKASLEPQELKNLIYSIRQVETALGSPYKQASTIEMQNRIIGRKSLVAAATIKAGEQFTKHNLSTKRAGDGISPINYWDWLNKKSTHTYEIDDLISP